MSLKSNPSQTKNTLRAHIPISTNTSNTYLTPYPLQSTSNPVTTLHLPKHTNETQKTQQSVSSHTHINEECEEDLDLNQSFPQTYNQYKRCLYNELFQRNYNNCLSIPQTIHCSKCNKDCTHLVAISQFSTYTPPPNYRCTTNCPIITPNYTPFQTAALAIQKCLKRIRTLQFKQYLMYALRRIKKLTRNALKNMTEFSPEFTEGLVTGSDQRKKVSDKDPMNNLIPRLVFEYRMRGSRLGCQVRGTGTLFSVRYGDQCSILSARHIIRKMTYKCNKCNAPTFKHECGNDCDGSQGFSPLDWVEPHLLRVTFTCTDMNSEQYSYGEEVEQFEFPMLDVEVLKDESYEEYQCAPGSDWAVIKIKDRRLAEYGIRNRVQSVKLAVAKTTMAEIGWFAIYGYPNDKVHMVGMKSGHGLDGIDYSFKLSELIAKVFFEHSLVDTRKGMSGAALWTYLMGANDGIRYIFAVHNGGKNGKNNATVFDESLLAKIEAFLSKRFGEFSDFIDTFLRLTAAEIRSDKLRAQSYDNHNTNTHQFQNNGIKRKRSEISANDFTQQNPNKRTKPNSIGNSNGRNLSTNIRINEHTNASSNNNYMYDNEVNSYAMNEVNSYFENNSNNNTHSHMLNSNRYTRNNAQSFHHTYPQTQNQPLQYDQHLIPQYYAQPTQQTYIQPIQQTNIQPIQQPYQTYTQYPYTTPQTQPQIYNDAWQQNSFINGMDMYEVNGGSESFSTEASMSPNTPPMPVQNIVSGSDNVQQNPNVIDAKPFKCDECPNAYAIQSTLTNHINRIHKAPPGGWRCSKCNKKLSSKGAVKRHIMNGICTKKKKM